MPSLMGIDYGGKRIGLALSGADGRVAVPLRTITAAANPVADADAVLAVAREYDIAAFVVGLPLNMDDTEGPQAAITRRFAEALRTRGGKPVHLHDERLSSFAADELAADAATSAGDSAPASPRARPRDALAAQVILQRFLDLSEPSA